MATKAEVEGLELIGKTLLNLVDPQPERAGVKETPQRYAAYMAEIVEGYRRDPKAILKDFEDGAEGYDEMVFQENIPFYSLCEHHMAPFFGVVHIGYIPDKRILGLSKFARLTEIFARRLQVQERLTNQIADAMATITTKGVGVVVRARHLCMESRGVRVTGSGTTTSALRGPIKAEPEARAEFLKFVELANARSPQL